jgi:hypothetical protein
MNAVAGKVGPRTHLSDNLTYQASGIESINIGAFLAGIDRVHTCARLRGYFGGFAIACSTMVRGATWSGLTYRFTRNHFPPFQLHSPGIGDWVSTWPLVSFAAECFVHLAD